MTHATNVTVIKCPVCKEILRLRDDGTIPGHAKGKPSQRVACEAIGRKFEVQP